MPQCNGSSSASISTSTSTSTSKQSRTLRGHAHSHTRSPAHSYLHPRLRYGPILLAAVASEFAAANPDNCSIGAADVRDMSLAGALTIFGIDIARDDPAVLLTRSPSPMAPHDLSFDVRGNPCVAFVPYYSVQFEEMSVYPAFQPRSSPPVQQQLCSVATENYPAETNAACLVCSNSFQAVANVTLAEFGIVTGSCAAGLEVNQSCRADPSAVRAYVSSRCAGLSSCSVVADADDIGVPDPCVGVSKQLAVQVTCGGKLCDIATENYPEETDSVTLGCDGNSSYVITKVVDAEFGELTGACPTFAPGGCIADPAAVRSVVEARCLGKMGCIVPANVALFGKDPCVGKVKQLAVRVECGTGPVARWSAVPKGWGGGE